MDSVILATCLSPVFPKAHRQPFGDLTGSVSNRISISLVKKEIRLETPKKEKPSNEDIVECIPTPKPISLTPTANLKLLMNVATAEPLPTSCIESKSENSSSQIALSDDSINTGSTTTRVCNNTFRSTIQTLLDVSKRHLFQDDSQEQKNLGKSVEETCDDSLVISDHDHYTMNASITQPYTKMRTISSAPHSSRVRNQKSGLLTTHGLGLLTPPSSSQESSCSSSGGGGGGSGSYTRKEKSLGLLCARMLDQLPERVECSSNTESGNLGGEEDHYEIHIDELAVKLKTERRRIYDVVNVLEAVQAMTKIGKNSYQWHGTTHQHMTLAWLRKLSLKLGMNHRYERYASLFNNNSIKPDFATQNTNKSSGRKLQDDRGFGAQNAHDGENNSLNVNCMITEYNRESSTSSSLGITCQKFLMLFLSADNPFERTVSLDLATRIIFQKSSTLVNNGVVEDSSSLSYNKRDRKALTSVQDESNNGLKTRVRRLYDIANILQTLQLIKKLQSGVVKKPSFQYIGPDVTGIEVTSEKLRRLPAARQRHSLLTIGQNILASSSDNQESSTKTQLFPETSSTNVENREPKKQCVHKNKSLNNTCQIDYESSTVAAPPCVPSLQSLLFAASSAIDSPTAPTPIKNYVYNNETTTFVKLGQGMGIGHHSPQSPLNLSFKKRSPFKIDNKQLLL